MIWVEFGYNSEKRFNYSPQKEEFAQWGVRKMEQQLKYQVDLTKIQGNGDFQCPKCGVTISPDDETDEVYFILEKKFGNNSLEELTIQCQKCRSEIRLIGFLTL